VALQFRFFILPALDTLFTDKIKLEKVIIPKLHGAWGIGAMTSSAVAFLVAANVSIAWHISTLMVIVWILTIYVIEVLDPSYSPKPSR
jgi:hypothetical protein